MPAIIEFVGVYEQNIIKPKSFIRDMYFKKDKLHETQRFEIEYRKGRQLVAPYVSELIPGTEMVKRTYESKIYTAPKVAPKRTFSANELFLEKIAGETIYGGLSPEEKKAKLLGESFTEFEEQITRREEEMCIATLYEGEIFVKGEGVEEKIKYGSVETITPTILWTNSNADIVGDITAIITTIGETTGTRPELITMDPIAAKLFLDNEKIQKLLDTKNYNIGEISPRELANGAIYLGTLAPFQIPIFSYQTQHQVLNDDGKTFKTKKLIPDGTVLFAPSINEFNYGPAADIQRGVIVAKRIPFEDKDLKNNSMEIRTESRPLPVPFDIDSIKILKVK